jgi:hypothetical protein
MDSSAEERVKASFKRVKGHIESLESEIKANRDFIIEQNRQIKAQNEQIIVLLDQIKAVEALKSSISKSQILLKKGKNSSFSSKKPNFNSKPLISSLSKGVSTGNKGGSLDGYSLNGYSLPSYSLDILKFKGEFPSIIRRLSRQEFLTFLTIYQQEEQNEHVTYDSVAKELKISAGCIRTYVSSVIKKGLPIIKSKYNNKIVILSIPTEIKGLNLKKKLIQVFYNQDPSQRKIDDSF